MFSAISPAIMVLAMSQAITSNVILRLERCLHAVHGLLGRLDDGVGRLAARPPKVVVVDRPEHDAAHALFHDVVSLLAYNVFVIVTNPKFVAVSVGSNLTGVWCNYLPIVILDSFTNLNLKLII